MTATRRTPRPTTQISICVRGTGSALWGRQQGLPHAMDQLTHMFGPKSEARIRYGDADYQILSPGDFVRCAVTGRPIPLADLRYWSVARQEPYVDARASLTRHLECLGSDEADA